MVAELLASWGVGALTKKLAKTVLESLAKDIAKDQGKSLLAAVKKRAAKLIPHDEYLKLYGKAIKELVEVIDEELQNAGIPAGNIDVYAKDLKQFVRTETLREALPNAFSTSAGTVEGHELKRGWPDETPLPPEFDWDFVAKAFNRKLKKLREDDGDFRAILQAQADRETAANTKQALGVQPDFQLRNYREALLERYANLHFDMMDTSGANYDGVKLWKVFVPQTVRESREYLPQLHEIPKEHLRRMVASGELDAKDAAMVREMNKELIEERQRAYLDQSPRSVLELAADDRLMRMVVLGDPGAGKSSFLQHLALEWARNENATERDALPLPLLIDLKEYDRWDCPNGKSFVRYLHDASTWHRLDQVKLDERLKAAKQPTVLLLDGLDEVFDLSRRSQVINDIHYFSNQYPQIRVIVTSRIIGYKPQRLADAEFSHFILQDLDETQVNDFLNRWHDTTFKNASDAAGKKARLARAISDSPAIRELAGNPLLLTMMAILNRNQELPRERIQLYEQASRLLLHQWDTERALDSHPQLKGHITAKEKTEMLREIAYAMQSAPEGLAGNLINEDELEAMLSRYLKEELGFTQPRAASRDLIEQLRLRNFILCYRGGGSYSFVHRTFLEYFCATAIHQRFVQKLDLDYLFHEIFTPHWQDEKWHEVLRLIAGIVGRSSPQHLVAIVNHLLCQSPTNTNRAGTEVGYRHILLAAECFQYLPNPQMFAVTQDKLSDALQDLLQVSTYTITTTYNDYQFGNGVTEKAIKLLASHCFQDDPCQWLRKQILEEADEDSFIPSTDEVRRANAIRELARNWKNDPDTLKLLKFVVKESRFGEWVCQAAMHEIVIGWKNDAETLPLLKHRLQNIDDRDTVAASLYDLATYWKSDVDTFLTLKQFARSDNVEWGDEAREICLEELFHHWKNNPDTFFLLKDRAVNDPSPSSDEDLENVRGTAMQLLARGWPDDPETLGLLREREKTHPTPWLREEAKQMADKLEAREMTPPPPDVKP